VADLTSWPGTWQPYSGLTAKVAHAVRHIPSASPDTECGEKSNGLSVVREKMITARGR
jgi:hypothetical protein